MRACSVTYKAREVGRPHCCCDSLLRMFALTTTRARHRISDLAFVCVRASRPVTGMVRSSRGDAPWEASHLKSPRPPLGRASSLTAVSLTRTAGCNDVPALDCLHWCASPWSCSPVENIKGIIADSSVQRWPDGIDVATLCGLASRVLGSWRH